ncbi:ergothioneine biosynthesis protein EgtB [Mucisphaera calidilacus]|nr:ergothioneine biosynthesis protein EgtB [Mucisphaera calidilacus]
MIEPFRAVRQQTQAIAEPLAPEDMVIQSMTEASPMKWHLAHTSWFFERFVLRDFVHGYVSPEETYDYLFNSYYNTVGPQHCRPRRGMLSRPTVEQVFAYRRFVDDAVIKLLERCDEDVELRRIMTIGLNHEQQHQELMLTDVKHVLSGNPLLPAVYPSPRDGTAIGTIPETGWRRFNAGVVRVGANPDDGFRFDNECPRHRVFLEPFEIADRPVTNHEYLAFVESGGYEQHQHWLSMGWATVQDQGWRHPIYWYREDGRWRQYTLHGPVDLRLDEPVCHLSYFEADAYARWVGARLPTEFEWEQAAADQALDGVIADEQRYHPAPLDPRETQPTRFFGDVWEWTGSSYTPYPGYRPPDGALGEYNGKFMCNQYVLRGGSCATARSQARLTYRNFFPPESRWQFAGLRLARTLAA